MLLAAILFALPALVVVLLRLLAVPRGGHLEVHPRYAPWLGDRGLSTVSDFLALDGPIVSGHLDRNVTRIELAGLTLYLKRERRVPWTVRWRSWWAGLGWSSRSVREARVLQALAREGFPAPEWLAAGETRDGRAFLLLLEVPQARELRAVLAASSPAERRQRVVRLARSLARLHTCGLIHPDLYASHVLIENPGPEERFVFLDWARCRRRPALTLRDRARALAALDATLRPDEVDATERLLGLRAYLRASHEELPSEQHARLLALLDRYRRQFASRRHVVEKSQPRLEASRQLWTCIEGEELCVMPALAEAFPDRAPTWLSLRTTQPGEPWPVASSGEAVRLERRSYSGRFLAQLVSWVRGHDVTAPEQRRAHLLLRLERYRVTVPQVLAMGQRWQGPGRLEAFLLTQPLPGALALGHWLRRSGRSPQRATVLRAAGQMVRRLHAAGCYLAAEAAWSEIAVQPGERPAVVLQSVDGLRVRRGYEERPAQADLARCQVLLAQHGCSRAEYLTFLSGYDVSATQAKLPTTAMPGPGGELPMTEPAPLEAQETPTRATFWQRVRRGVRRLWQKADWLRVVAADWGDTIMSQPVTDRHHAKQGRSTGRLIMPASADDPNPEPLRVYLKRHYELPWWHRLFALLWPGGGWSPAAQELRHLEKARRLGVPVPEVVAAGEYIGPGLRLQSFLAVRELTGMLPLHEAIPLASKRMTPEAFGLWKRGLILEMARLTRLLHDRNWFHKDLYLCHFYIDEAFTHTAPEAWRERVVMIDLHRLGHHPWTWAIWQMKDLAQLLFSAEVEGVTDRDRLAFWHAYKGPGPRRWWEGWLRWFVVLKWRRYRAHNERHPGHRQPSKPVATEDRP